MKMPYFPLGIATTLLGMLGCLPLRAAGYEIGPAEVGVGHDLVRENAEQVLHFDDQIAAVPEPSAWTFFIGGVAALILLQNRGGRL